MTLVMRPGERREAPDLSNGGVVVVAIGEGGAVPPEYGFHGQVFPLEAWKLKPDELDNAIPHNARALIFGTGKDIPRPVFDSIHEVLRRRRVVYLIKNSVAAVKSALDDIIPKAATEPKPAAESAAPAGANGSTPPKKQIAGRGQVSALVENYLPELLLEDPQMPTAEAARRLFRMAQQAGVTTTTVDSLAQAVRTYKKNYRIGERPQSVIPESKRVLQRIDAAIIELQQCRGYIEQLEARNALLEGQVAKAHEVFLAFQGEVFGKK